MRSVFRWATISTALALCASLSACQPPPRNSGYAGTGIKGVEVKPQKTIDAQTIPTQDDIYEVVHFWQQLPWLYEGNKPVGFKVPTYFLSSQTRKGTYVSGPIFVSLFRFDRAKGPEFARQLAYRWELSPADAMPFRIAKQTLLGYGYGFMLKWPDELDVAGREIDVEISYQRGDGRTIKGSSKRLRVPSGPDIAAPARGR